VFSGTHGGPTTTGDSTTTGTPRSDRRPADQPDTEQDSPRRQRLCPVPSAAASPAPDLAPDTVAGSERNHRRHAPPCAVCGLPLWPTRAAAGDTAHRSCEPVAATRSAP
jgi:hypothetical protein